MAVRIAASMPPSGLVDVIIADMFLGVRLVIGSCEVEVVNRDNKVLLIARGKTDREAMHTLDDLLKHLQQERAAGEAPACPPRS